MMRFHYLNTIFHNHPSRVSILIIAFINETWSSKNTLVHGGLKHRGTVLLCHSTSQYLIYLRLALNSTEETVPPCSLIICYSLNMYCEDYFRSLGSKRVNCIELFRSGGIKHIFFSWSSASSPG